MNSDQILEKLEGKSPPKQHPKSHTKDNSLKFYFIQHFLCVIVFYSLSRHAQKHVFPPKRLQVQNQKKLKYVCLYKLNNKIESKSLIP